MEVARGLGELLKTGWRPKRTIILALWDGEEWGLLGSTEWAEKHAAELDGKGVVYINTDGTGKGWLQTGGSHSLQQFITEVARDVSDPKTGKPLLEVARAKAILDLPEGDRAEAEKDPAIRIAPLGSGSDFTPFLQHLTVASLNLSFGGESPGGVYHSVYDSFNWYTRYSDGDFIYGRTLAQVTGTAVLRLSESAVLPFRFSDMSDTLGRYVADVQKLAAGKKDAPALDFAPLTAAVAALSKASAGFEKAHAAVPAASAKTLETQQEALKVVNQLVFSSERRLGNDAGLPRRDWFKHQVYAPGFYTGYGVKTLPQIREGLEEGKYDEAKEGVTKVAAAINALAQQVDRASAALTRVGR
jgi:N-acetylated-alpha-linked acidic dipeptidase